MRNSGFEDDICPGFRTRVLRNRAFQNSGFEDETRVLRIRGFGNSGFEDDIFPDLQNSGFENEVLSKLGCFI